jgi:hypothetical protein
LRRIRRLSFAERFAVVLVAVAVAIWAIWEWTSFLDAWAPNIATAALTVALTITLVEEILRRDAQRRLEPRLFLARFWIGTAISQFISCVALDYAETRLTNSHPVPNGGIKLLDQWIDDASDSDPAPLLGDKYPFVFEAGTRLAAALKRHAQPEREHLPSGLVVAIDSVSRTIDDMEPLAASAAASKLACGNVVAAARYVAEQLLQTGAAEASLEVGEAAAKAAEARRQDLLRQRDDRLTGASTGAHPAETA